MVVKNLSKTSFEDLMDCFLQAFENYYINMPTDFDFYRERWRASKVDFNFSYGMFDQDKLVGFIIHSIDKRQGELVAYNSGTGVIPQYRGKRIVQSIYQQALNDLKLHGIKKSTLEVITQNERAIASYQKVGFQQCKTYHCFNGRINLKLSIAFELQEIPLQNTPWDIIPNQEFYSWDNQKESVLRGSFKTYQVINNGELESFFIIKPENGYVAQWDLLKPNEKAWERLFSAIKSISKTIKINNVDYRLSEKIKCLDFYGLTNFIDQYEMELIL